MIRALRDALHAAQSASDDLRFAESGATHADSLELFQLIDKANRLAEGIQRLLSEKEAT